MARRYEGRKKSSSKKAKGAFAEDIKKADRHKKVFKSEAYANIHRVGKNYADTHHMNKDSEEEDTESNVSGEIVDTAIYASRLLTARQRRRRYQAYREARGDDGSIAEGKYAEFNGKYDKEKDAEVKKEKSGKRLSVRDNESAEIITSDSNARKRGPIKHTFKSTSGADGSIVSLKDEKSKSESYKIALKRTRMKQRMRQVHKEAEQVKDTTIVTANITTKVAHKMADIIKKNAGTAGIITIIGLLFITISSLFVSCAAMFGDSVTTTIGTTYMSEPREVDAADLEMTRLEMELQMRIDHIEEEFPDYDEYEYNLGEIGHDPFTLISYLSAKYIDFNAADLTGEIQSLFDEMYELTLTPATEIRTKTEINEDTGLEEEVEVEVSILRVELTVTPLEDIVTGKLTADNAPLYECYNETKGALQVLESPTDYYWYLYVSSYYGYRVNPISGEEEFHRGVDIAIPEGSTVYATHAGTVTAAGYDESFGNYVVITDDLGYTTKYAHLSVLNVSSGETVRKGKIIGKVGATGATTGAHLHIEIMYNGEYYNPYFYFLAGTQTMYGETTGGSGATDFNIPDSYSDADVDRLMKEAEKYLGLPYVWGGSNPTTGFDCSGFVCYVFKHSGVYPLERVGAQAIYNMSTPIPASEAKAGDLIFFQGTYNSGNPVSHIGIYCGNGVMIHCGDPIKYANINSPYWQSHFYGFTRLQ